MVIFYGYLLFKVLPKNSAEVLARAPKHKKDVMCLSEKYMLDNLCSDIGYSAIIHEFNVKKQYIYILHKLFLNGNTYKTRLHIVGPNLVSP